MTQKLGNSLLKKLKANATKAEETATGREIPVAQQVLSAFRASAAQGPQVDKSSPEKVVEYFADSAKVLTLQTAELPSSSDFFEAMAKVYFGSELLTDMFRSDASYEGDSFHLSSLRRDCERQLYFNIVDPPARDKLSPTSGEDIEVLAKRQLIFAIGKFLHLYVQFHLLQAGVLDRAEVPVSVPDKRLNSRADGVTVMMGGKKFLLEVKSSNSFGYRKYVAGPSEDHIFQASNYAAHLGINDILFVYINKDTADIVLHTIPVSKKAVQEANDKMAIILNAPDVASLNPQCSSIFSEAALACPFRGVCFEIPKTSATTKKFIPHASIKKTPHPASKPVAPAESKAEVKTLRRIPPPIYKRPTGRD